MQFHHPGREQRPGPGGGQEWNRRAADEDCAPTEACGPGHARKFMQLDGEWIDQDDEIGCSSMWAWGEWEAQSDLIRELDQMGDPAFPRYLWEPFYARRPHGYRGLHNTDPFIFGDRFLYSNCHQRWKPKLRALQRGSVIAFGSKKGDWVLDTVLVVADSVPYSAEEAPFDWADLAPEAFLDVTGGPLAANEAGASFRLYWGATPNDPVDGMFSFFPAVQAGGDVGFKRPSIELPERYFTKTLHMGAKATLVPTTDVTRELWESLVAQVREADLLLGTHATVPERRPSQAAG
ncbi:MAG: hypothetical protein OXG66_04650 [Acidimicrobiaceae bacterium]|nr:hypothetical protein [Acidimicrobiaceae bacterium]